MQPRRLALDPEVLLHHSEWLRELARSLVGDPQAADDLVQNAWISLSERRSGEVRGLRPYLAGVVRNLALQWKRETGRRARREQAVAADEALPSSAELVERLEIQRILVDVLERLSEPQRTTILLRYAEGLSSAEIARRQGVRAGAVRARLKRGLDEMRERLDERFGGDRTRWQLALVPWISSKALVVESGVTLLTGAFLMKTILSALAAVIVLCLFLWRIGVLDSQRNESLPNTVATEIAKPTPSIDVSTGGVHENAAESRIALTSNAADTSSAVSKVSSASNCVIFGRVVDEDGHGIAGARVTFTNHPRWAEDLDVPVTVDGFKLQGFEQRTGADGRFRIEAPMPTVSSVFFTLIPDDDHDLIRTWYGGGREGEPPPLHEGENDLGEFRLKTTGALTGTVRDRAGAPIVGAEVDLGPDLIYTEDRSATTDASGRYTLGHARAGSHGVKVNAKGYLGGFAKPFEVKLGETSAGPDFVLDDAPTIRGRIVDGQHRPLADASIWATPSAPGMPTDATSELDGTFVLHLPTSIPYSLTVRRKEYAPQERTDDIVYYKPGTDDVEIVLTKDVLTTFVVVDAESGAPITRFSLEVERNKGLYALTRDSSFTGWTPQYGNHPDGELTTGARPGIDRYRIAAEGHARQEGEIQHESAASPRQVLRLGRGIALIGRVTSNHAPVIGARVQIESGTTRPRWDESGKEGPPVFHPTYGDLHYGQTDAQGRFRVQGLDDGEHRVTIQGAHGAPLVIHPVNIGGSTEKDLGELELAPGAILRGEVRVGSGTSSANLIVYLDEGLGAPSVRTDARGRFQFAELSAGKHALNVKEQAGVVAAGPPMELELTPGETKDIVFDVSSRGVCAVALRVLFSGQPAADVDVYCHGPDTGPFGERVGKTSTDGWLRTSIRAMGSAHVRVAAADGAPIGIDATAIELASRGGVERTIDLPVASLTVEWTRENGQPADGPIDVFLWPSPATEKRDPELPPYLVQGMITAGSDVGASSRCVIAAVGAGEYEVSLAVPSSKVAHGVRQELDYIGNAHVTAGVASSVMLHRFESK